MAYLSKEELINLGFKSIGENVKISSITSFYNCKNITIGNNVRIDDFCVLSAGVGGIFIGDYIHIAVGSTLIGAAKIVLKDFCNISSRVSIYSSSDDYSGAFMTNPMIPSNFTNVFSKEVILEKHVIIGAGSVILPGVNLGVGVSVGAISLVNKDCKEFGIYCGIPAKKIKDRQKTFLQFEKFLKI
jgi:acetyltransferase-like isoleucine patch superfamily enzyme